MPERVGFDPAELGPKMYPLLNSVVLPRPIAWVSTRSADGVDNVAPHSYFTVASTEPPVVQFTSVGEKDSLRNVLATGEFVVNLCTRELAEQVNATGTDFPPEVDEFEEVGLHREPSAKVTPPRVAESPVALECRLAGTRAFGKCTVVFGEVVQVWVRPDVLRDGMPAVDLLRPVARMGGSQWCAVGEILELRRIPYREGTAR